MKSRTIWSIRNLLVVLLCLVIAGSGFLFYYNHTAFYIALPFLLALAVYTVVQVVRFQKGLHDFLVTMSSQFDITQKEALNDFPMPVIVCNEIREIIWYNERFRETVLGGVDAYGENMDVLIRNSLEDFLNPEGVRLEGNGRSYTVYGICSKQHAVKLYMLYFADNTKLQRIADRYQMTRPSVILILIDNYEEIFEDTKESVKSAITGSIDKLVEDFIAETNGFVRRLSRDRFIAVVEEQHLEKMIEDKFSLLEKARNITNDNRMPVTLSIGVGHGAKDLSGSETFARQALDMALGRGGDQAAVKTKNGFDFYGGVSKGVEKQAKVKTRIVASAIAELIHANENVIVMGHKFGDLDSVGSAVGLAQCVRGMGKPAVVAVDYPKNLATSLIDKVVDEGSTDLFVSPLEAKRLLTPHTLLIITDTHNPDFVESKELYEKATNVVIIDHHRKMVDYINNALVFYHEPYASSASEMVTELTQYMGAVRPGKTEAEALLAGIMLDTRNFTLRTGVRTFEAAAYLRKMGADTVSVKKLFANSIDSYQRKTKIVSSAEIYSNVAVAISDGFSDDMRIVASQAADELLGVSNVDAAFVLYASGNGVSISARSMGAVNVQVIMEFLGGGGHQTMAGTQMADTDLDAAKQLLFGAIDKYNSNK